MSGKSLKVLMVAVLLSLSLSVISPVASMDLAQMRYPASAEKSFDDGVAVLRPVLPPRIQEGCDAPSGGCPPY